MAPRGAECSLILIGDARMAALNRTYRGTPHPTDVLAFPAEQAGMPAGGGGGRAAPGGPYLGDLAISLETAGRQAARRGHPLEREAALLMIHGILHLVGYDHRTPTQRGRMWRVQNRLLRAHGGPARKGARRPLRRT
ncbi:MAG TPA: rRNA maturation RNase YbeY [Candidatus Methylomirabilis sp.]